MSRVVAIPGRAAMSDTFRRSRPRTRIRTVTTTTMVTRNATVPMLIDQYTAGAGIGESHAAAGLSRKDRAAVTPATGEPFAHPFPVARLAACPPTHRPAAVTPTAAIPPMRSRSDPAIAGPVRDLLITSISP